MCDTVGFIICLITHNNNIVKWYPAALACCLNTHCDLLLPPTGEPSEKFSYKYSCWLHMQREQPIRCTHNISGISLGVEKIQGAVLRGG